MESYTVCTQIISEMSDRMMWMGFLMFGVGICMVFSIIKKRNAALRERQREDEQILKKVRARMK